MKDCSEALLDIIPDPKAVRARATFRVTRPAFAVSAVAGSVTDPSLVDTCPYGTGLLQVTNIGDKLNTRCITDVNGVWPAWTDSGIALKAASKPGADGGHVWYQKSDGSICHRDYSNFTVEVDTTVDYANATTLAPIGSSRCYALWVDTIAHLELVGSGAWAGRVFNTSNRLDAVTVTDPFTGTTKDYLYYMNRDAGRIVELSCYPASLNWGQPRSIVPIDAIDDVYGLKLHHASVINGQVAVTGRLARTSDADPISMDVYLTGPENFSMGREMFISDQLVGGGLLVVGTQLICAGATKKAVATGTNSFGVDTADLKLVVSGIVNLRLTESEGRSSFLTMELDPDLAHPALTTGSEVVFEFAYNDEWMTALTCEVENIRRTDDEGQTLLVSMVSKTMKRIGQWAPDQGVYIPSQAYAIGIADDLSQFIRGQGKYTATTRVSLTSADFNTWNVLYTAARSSRNGLMRARFYNEATQDRTNRNPRFGVGLNYYRETAGEAAIRLGVEPDTIEENQLGHNGLVAIYSRSEYDATHSGLALYSWVNSIMTQLTKVSVDLPHLPSWIWLQMSFNEGVVRVDYRVEGTAAWTNILTYSLTANYPWMTEAGGAGCALMQRQLLVSQPSYGLTDIDVTLGVDDNSVFGAAGTVLIDEEQITFIDRSTYNQIRPDLASPTKDAFPCYPPGFRPGDAAFNSTSTPIVAWCSYIGNRSFVDDFYKGAALCFTQAASASHVYPVRTLRCMAYDPSQLSPYALLWTPSASWYQGWKSTINDNTLGSWQTTLAGYGNPLIISTFYADADPSTFLSFDSSDSSKWLPYSPMRVRPALYVGIRGANGTTAVFHDDSVAWLAPAIDLRVANIEFYTGDEDIILIDALRSLLVQAGGACKGKYELDMTRAIPAAQWDTILVPSQPLDDFIAEIDIPADLGDGFGIGMVFRAPVAVPPVPNAGYRLELARRGSAANVNLYKNGTTLIQSCTVAGVPFVGTAKISVQDARIAVWLNHTLLIAYNDVQIATGAYKAFIAYNPGSVAGKSVRYRFHELNDLLADINVGVRGKGTNALSEVLGDRTVYFRQEPDGSMFFYKTPSDAGTLPDIVCGIQDESSDSRVSRLRAEGVSVVEVADFQALSDVGNIFETINSQYANSIAEIGQDASLYLLNLKRHAGMKTLSTMVHPALQPGDTCVVDLNGIPTTLQIVATDLALGFQGDNFVADMNIQAFEP